MQNLKINLISIIYANIQKPLSTFIAPCPYIIHTEFRQNQTKSDREEAIVSCGPLISIISLINVIYADTV